MTICKSAETERHAAADGDGSRAHGTEASSAVTKYALRGSLLHATDGSKMALHVSKTKPLVSSPVVSAAQAPVLETTPLGPQGTEARSTPTFTLRSAALPAVEQPRPKAPPRAAPAGAFVTPPIETKTEQYATALGDGSGAHVTDSSTAAQNNGAHEFSDHIPGRSTAAPGVLFAKETFATVSQETDSEPKFDEGSQKNDATGSEAKRARIKTRLLRWCCVSATNRLHKLLKRSASPPTATV